MSPEWDVGVRPQQAVTQLLLLLQASLAPDGCRVMAGRVKRDVGVKHLYASCGRGAACLLLSFTLGLHLDPGRTQRPRESFVRLKEIQRKKVELSGQIVPALAVNHNSSFCSRTSLNLCDKIIVCSTLYGSDIIMHVGFLTSSHSEVERCRI